MRNECLKPAQHGWEPPTPAEIREVLKMTGLSGSEAAARLGLNVGSGEQSAGGRVEILKSRMPPGQYFVILRGLKGYGDAQITTLSNIKIILY